LTAGVGDAVGVGVVPGVGIEFGIGVGHGAVVGVANTLTAIGDALTLTVTLISVITVVPAAFAVSV
jgi:hypothetical protein